MSTGKGAEAVAAQPHGLRDALAWVWSGGRGHLMPGAFLLAATPVLLRTRQSRPLCTGCQLPEAQREVTPARGPHAHARGQ